VLHVNVPRWVGLFVFAPILACGFVRQPTEPVELEQLAFEIQTATPTISALFDAPTSTPDPNATATFTATRQISVTRQAEAEATPTEQPVPPTAKPETVPPSTATPQPEPTVPVAEPLSGGEWDFEAGFTPWPNPFGDSCDGSALAIGWTAFTTRDEHGSSCMNQTVWKDNVKMGGSAQEITFAFVGNTAGIFKTAPTAPGHQYTVEAFIRREFSPTKVEVAMGIDLTGGANWEADTVHWFPWREDFDDRWARTEETVTATGENMIIFIKGAHPLAVGGGALRIDSISVVDLGP